MSIVICVERNLLELKFLPNWVMAQWMELVGYVKIALTNTKLSINGRRCEIARIMDVSNEICILIA